MRRVLSVAIVVGLAGAAIVVAPPRIVAQRGDRLERESVNGRDVVAREVLVKFRQPPSTLDLTQIRAEGDASDIRSIGRAGLFRLRSRSRNVPALLTALQRRPDVAYVEPNFIVRLISEPNDPQYPQLWALKNIGQAFEGLAGVPGADIHAVPAWGITLGSTANVVAIIDTGIDYTHPDLVANLWSAPTAFTVNIDGAPITCAAGTHGFNAITRSCDPRDDQDHGSHVSGTIGATGDNGTGVVGVNWTTRLMAIKFIDATGEGTTEDAIASVEFALAVKQRFAATGDANIRVLSNSWGGYDFSQALLDEVNAANDADMLFVAGAGNDSTDNDADPFYPASFDAPNVISVAATDNTDDLAWFSNYGSSTVNLGAPGVDILSTVRNGQYAFLSGTSMATPHVSGAAALLLSACTLDTASVKEALLGTADLLPTLTGTTTTGGRLDVYSALSSCIAPPAAPTGLTAHGADTKVTLSWSASLGATRYNVKRSPTPGGPYSSINAAVQGASYTDPNVTNGTTYYYVVSASNFEGESGDSNEASATPHIPPDAIVSSFTVPSTGAAPSTISVTVTTKNQGNGTAGPSTTRVYWSDDAQLDPSDTLLMGQDVPQLLSGAQNTVSLSLSIPSAAPGTHYLIANADADDVLDENNEGNNTAARPIRIGPDLVLQSLSAPASGGTDSTIVVTDTTQNSGGGPAAASVVRFYLSANSVLDSGDTLLNGSRGVGPLDPGASSSGSTTVTIPASMAPGSYYIVAKADADGTVAETSETNNTYARLIVLGGDLALSAMTIPAKGGPGGVITISDTTMNLGAGPVAASTTRFYLSTNSVLDAADIPLSARQVPSLAAGASSSGSTALTLPVVPTGPYYIIARADDDNGVVESRETNNTLARTIAIGGDLVVSALAAPSTGGGGLSLIITDTTTNQGGGSIGASTTKFYLSADGLIDGSDVPLGARDVGPLDGGASSAGSTTVTIAATTQPGSYYILAKADAAAAVAETVETNNTFSRVLVIGSDLLVSTLTVPTKGGAGGTITVSDTTTNSGGGPAAASVTRFYLSANTTVDAGDSPLGGAHAVPDLAAGAASTASTTLTLPAVAAGPYYIIARADDNNVVVESRETNNTVFRSISIGPDLAVTAFTVPTVGAPGVSMTVTESTTNQGGGSVAPTTTRFYLSTTSVLDPGDVLVGSRPVPGLDAGAINSGSTVVTIPSNLVAGSYYLIAKADADDTSLETSETNNTYARALQIGSDLWVSALTVPAKGAAGSSIVVTDTTTNNGGGDSSAASVTAFYLSTSSAGGAGDVLLDGSRTVPPLAPGASSTGSTTVTIPAQTAPGTFYVIAKTDFGNTIAETNETNNSRWRSISIGPDLSFSSLSLSPISLAAGANLSITDKVTNQGGGVASPSATRFYLSTNATLDGADGVLGGRLVPELAAAASNSGSTTVAIPGATVPGTYYVIAQADGDGAVAETVETNNVSVIRSIQIIAGP